MRRATIRNATSPIFAFLPTALVVRHETVTGRMPFRVEAFDGFGQDLRAQLAIVMATVCYAGAAMTIPGRPAESPR